LFESLKTHMEMEAPLYESGCALVEAFVTAPKQNQIFLSY